MKRSVCLFLLPLLAAPALAEPDPTAADAVERLGLDLYHHVGKGEANLFYSPFSISAALTMTREGARGATAAEMDKVLHLPANRASAYKSLVSGLRPRLVRDYNAQPARDVPAYQLNVANNLWGQQGFSFSPAFTQALGNDYRAPLQRIDFLQTAKARKAINDWVAKQTKDRIKDIVPEGLPLPSTRLALANAIHFKANWQEAFKKRLTREKPFHTADGREVTVKMMRRVGHMGYFEDAEAQVVELPYRGRDTSMVVVLPRKRNGLAALAKGLTTKRLAAWRQASKHPRVDVRLPRFRFTSSLDLTKTLPKMGMPTAFNARLADFSGMTTQQRLFIGAVLHKAFVAVDEKGTEAAAATVVLMLAGAAPAQETPKLFQADHPFLFFIRHRKTGCVLFMGRVGDPSVKS